MSSHTSYFFDLAFFAHKRIFDQCTFPWEALPNINRYLKSLTLGKIDGSISPQAYLIDPELISIGEGTIVEPGAYIKGPCIVGKNCVIRHGAYIRGDFIAGDGCVIGHDTEIKNSIFLQNTHAAHFAYIGDSILGNDVNLGAGTKCANLKLDRSFIHVDYQEEVINTKLKKFGAVFGDKSEIGCNAVTNPGTLIGMSVCCYPCINVRGFIPSNSIIKPESGFIVVPKEGKS